MRHRRCITPPGSGGRRRCGVREPTRAHDSNGRVRVRCGVRDAAVRVLAGASRRLRTVEPVHATQPRRRHGAVTAAYDVSDAVVVDVGGGSGALLAAILHTYTSARGVLLDHDTVVADAHRVLDGADVAAR